MCILLRSLALLAAADAFPARCKQHLHNYQSLFFAPDLKSSKWFSFQTNQSHEIYQIERPHLARGSQPAVSNGNSTTWQSGSIYTADLLLLSQR